MALTSTTAAVLAASATAASAAVSVRQGRLQQEAGKLQERIAESRSAADRRKMVRQERIRRAQLVNASANQGTQGSSGESSALGGITSQTATNLAQSSAVDNVAGRLSKNQQLSTNLGTAGALFDATRSTSSIFM